MAYSKQERLSEFFLRMSEAPPAGTFEEAYQLLCQTLNRVEDAYSGVPNNPDNWKADGRMYPPQYDTSYRLEDNEDIIAFQSRLHTTYISDRGAIAIWSRAAGVMVFEKPGKNGGRIER